eukprot:scaffold18280_cov199-Amphora_coffeaeformis.AAC.1
MAYLVLAHFRGALPVGGPYNGARPEGGPYVGRFAALNPGESISWRRAVPPPLYLVLANANGRSARMPCGEPRVGTALLPLRTVWLTPTCFVCRSPGGSIWS